MKRLRLLTFLIVVLQVAMLIGSPQALFLLGYTPPKAEAATKTLTASADFSQGEFSSTESTTKEGEVKLQGDGTWNARVWRTPYLTLTDGTTFASDGSDVYMIIGRDTRFVKYVPSEDTWVPLAEAPHMPNSGADMIVVGNYIYVEFGGYQNEFSRYSIADNTWTDVAHMPDLTFSGSSLTTDGTDIYALHGAATTDFWKYTVSTNTWSTLTSAPATMSSGADLIYYDGAIYTPRGSNTKTMYKYTLSSNTWATLANAPQNLNDNGNLTRVGSDIYVMRGTTTTDFFKYSITDDTWTTLTSTPATTRYVGAVYNASENRIYVFHGNSTYDWWKYDPDSDSFDGPADLPAAAGNGADLVYYNGDVYYRRGANTTAFYKYNVSGGTWTTLAVAPGTVNDDTKGIRAGSYLYYYRGSNTTSFYRYNPSGDSWSTMGVTPANVSYGSSLAYPGSGDYIYGTRGANTTAFWRYSISTDTWDDVGAVDLPAGYTMGYGARLISDGTDIYAITGSGVQSILKYTVSTNTWSLLGSIPFSPYWGTDIVYYNGKIFAQAGYYKTELWEYTISTNTWRRLPDMSGMYASDIGPYNGGSLAVDTSNGVLYSINGTNFTRLLNFTVSSNAYPTSGTWTSDAIDLTYAASLDSLTTSTTTPGNSSISFETRTSADKITWSSWESVTGGTIASAAHRYIEIRATLNATSDQTATPTLSSVSINYTGDTTAPGNPETVSGMSQSISGVSITSATGYTYPHPYFSWDDATDSESSIAGYYVYFGTDSSASPVTQGNFQTQTTYTVTTPMSTGNYYLRLVTKDSAGNVSEPTTEFTYVYTGVSPPTTSLHNTTADFTTGTATDVATSGNAIKLASKAGFWQQNRLSTAPGAMSYGASFAYVKSTGMLYTFRGANTTTFYSYDTNTDTWTTLSAAPSAVYQGGDLVEGPSGYLFGFPGKNTNSFWRYDIANDTWSDTAAADAPYALYYGSSMIYDGSRYIYVTRGNNDDIFMRYDTQTDTWDTLASASFGSPDTHITNNVYIGGDLSYDGTDTIYAIQGNSYSGFSSYSIAANSWTTLPNLPVLPYDGAQISYDSTSNAIYYISGWTNPFLYKFDVSTQTWSRLADAPLTMSAGSTMRNVNGILYILRGANTTTLWTYDIAKASWQVPTMGLFGVAYQGTDYRPFGYGAKIVKGDGDYYYLTRGNYDNLFVRYDSATGEAVQMAEAPVGFYTGSSLVYDSTNDKIYAIGSSGVQKLYVYDVATDTWSEDSSDTPPAAPGTGASFTYDGSRYIYWNRGSNTTSFYRYDTQAAAGSRWSSALANAPGGLNYGSQLLYKDSYVYVLKGGNTANNPFYRYNPTANSWTTLAPLSTAVYYDGFLVDGGNDTLYACRATNTASCFSYSITGNSWSSIADAPANIYQGGSAASNGTDRMFVIAGAGGTNTYTDGLYSYIFQSATSSFEESGTFVSDSIDLGSIYKFADLDLTYTAADNTGLTVYTRTSDDNSTWSDWSQASDDKKSGSDYTYSITSPTHRYIQVKFALTSDGIYSGSIGSYSVNYYQDSNAPSNPTTLTATTSASESATLTSGNWYNYSSPYFSWPAAEAEGGASDTTTGSGIAGYYVYFGTESTADPKTDGTLQTTTNYTGSSMTSGNTYYLRVKAVDNAGNVAATAWQAYTYKFDNVAPDNPTTVTADPSGYTATNNFNFAWSGATDSASLVTSYCYKTTLNGSETCGVSGDSVSGVHAGGTGASTFYVRAVDGAGNMPSSYASVSYYYSATAPSAPRNLEVTPSSNSVNQFSFSWDPPSLYFGAQANLRYFYSVNALPTSENVNQIGLTNTNLATDAYATVPGDNIMYVVAKDEAGNIDYHNYASVTFTANTSAPGITRNMDISDVSVKSTQNWRLAVSWDAPTASGSGVASYKVYRSAVTDAVCSSDFSDFNYLASTTTESYVDTGLAQQTYAYCVKACDSTNNCSATSDTVSMVPTGKWTTAPDLTASPSASIKTKSALISWSTSRTANSFVKYGTASGNYGNEVGSSEQISNHNITLTGLDPGTTYYYKVSWTDEDGNEGTSDEATFTTNPAPFVSGVKVINIGLYSAYVQFTIKNATSATVEYGKTLSYGGTKAIATSKDESTQTILLDELTEDTPYHLRILAEDEEENVFSGDDYSFATLAVPKIENLVVQQVVDQPTATLRLIWASNTPISTIVTYYPSVNSALAEDQISLTPTTSHQAIIKNLRDNTEYTILVRGKDSAGNEANADPKTVQTAVDFRPPTISNVNVDSSIIGAGDSAKAQIVVSWDTDEPGTSQVQFAEGTGSNYGQTTQLDGGLTTNHIVTITGVTPAKIYHLQALSKDKSGNLGKSFDTVIVTPNPTQSALNLVIDNLSKTFGFLNNLSLQQ